MDGLWPEEVSFTAVETEKYRRHMKELTKLRHENATLKRRFETLFKVPPKSVTPVEVGRHPKYPGQWIVRAHVKAFTVEGTIGELTAGKINPTAAWRWQEEFAEHNAALADGLKPTLDQLKLRIGLRVFDAESVEIEEVK